MPQSQSIPQQQVILPEYLHPSPISLDEPIKHEQAAQSKPHEYEQRERDSSASSEHEVDGLGQVNEHTEGAEFYGPTGTFYFLARLRSRANTQKQPEVGIDRKQSSIVNLLHSSDYSTPPDSRVIGQHPYGKGSPQNTVARRESYQQGINPDMVLSATDASLATDIERECARLYFQNLHNIHPILEQMTFLKRCEEEIWSRASRPDILMCSQMRREARFLALYNVVVAIGAITAGEISTLMEDHTREFLDRTGQSGEDDSLYPPIRLARRLFERSRLHLEDICESSSLETAQTLFLMSVFGQNALKPHSCYMYSGMAIRTASAMGIPTNIRSETSPESLLWWSPIRIAGTKLLFDPVSEDFTYCLINPMVDLAKILMWMTDNLSLHSNHTSMQRLSQTALNLDRELDDWKSGLPRQLRFDMSSLEDSEFAMKQKTVLKLRRNNLEVALPKNDSLTRRIGFLNARILLHRQFIISKTLEADRNTVSRHVTSCVNAATETIKFMHTSYLHRPYFRTWWYNCMYLLDACMVLLHVLISNICPFPAEEVMENIELSLDIFKAMKMLAVARRCADIVKELLHVAAQTHSGQQRQNSVTTETEPAMKAPDGGSQLTYTSPAFTAEGMATYAGGTEVGDAMIPGDFDANLVDPNVVWNFLNFEHWNAWSDAAFK
ncbi:C6 transcription factor [Colletotrichum incanum]|nr:C6 transcription factor [Colletotrichum incanum]